MAYLVAFFSPATIPRLLTFSAVLGSYAMNLKVGAVSWLASGEGNSYTVIWNNVLLTLTARRNTYGYRYICNLRVIFRTPSKANDGPFIFAETDQAEICTHEVLTSWRVNLSCIHIVGKSCLD